MFEVCKYPVEKGTCKYIQISCRKGLSRPYTVYLECLLRLQVWPFYHSLHPTRGCPSQHPVRQDCQLLTALLQRYLIVVVCKYSSNEYVASIFQYQLDKPSSNLTRIIEQFGSSKVSILDISDLTQDWLIAEY